MIYDKNHPLVLEAKKNQDKIIEKVTDEEYEYLFTQVPSLKGMYIGNIGEFHFMKMMKSLDDISNVFKPDDHDRSLNKSDLIVTYRNTRIRFQVKSIQSNSLRFNTQTGKIEFTVQNDGSDKREIVLPNGHKVSTTNYVYGDYDILVVPLITVNKDENYDKWEYGFLLNSDCRPCTNRKIPEEDRKFLMSSSEILTYPLSGKWTKDVYKVMNSVVSKIIQE